MIGLVLEGSSYFEESYLWVGMVTVALIKMVSVLLGWLTLLLFIWDWWGGGGGGGGRRCKGAMINNTTSLLFKH